MLKKMLLPAAWLMLGGLALVLAADRPVLAADDAAADAPAETWVDAGAGHDGTLLEAPVDQRQVQTDLINGWNDRLTLLDFAEGALDWLKSVSAFARANSALVGGAEDLVDLETIEQYSLAAYGPKDDNGDQWFVAVRYRHHNQKFNYDFDFAPAGDKMALKAVRENQTALSGRKLKELLTDIFNRAAKPKE